MGKVKEILYEKNKNLGNYENVKIGVTVTVDQEEDPGKMFERAKDFVKSKLEKE